MSKDIRMFIMGLRFKEAGEEPDESKVRIVCEHFYGPGRVQKCPNRFKYGGMFFCSGEVGDCPDQRILIDEKRRIPRK